MYRKRTHKTQKRLLCSLCKVLTYIQYQHCDVQQTTGQLQSNFPQDKASHIRAQEKKPRFDQADWAT